LAGTQLQHTGLSFGRLRPLHTNAVIFAFGGSALFATSYYVVQRIEHQGAAFIDVISPCVAFNNHTGSTKSFDYVREHNEAVNRLDFMTAAHPSRSTTSRARSRWWSARRDDDRAQEDAADYDASDRLGAMSFLQHHAAKGQIVTASSTWTASRDLHHNSTPWMRR